MIWTLALELAYWQQTAIKLVAVALVIPTAALILGYVFLMKMMSFMQSRLGPMEAGPYGTLQLLADGVKFLQKEDVFPRRADRYVFALAPVVVLVSTFLLYVVLPVGPDAVVSSLDAGLFFALAVASLSVIGGLRAAGQLIAYELPLVLAAIGVVIQAGTLDLNKIVVAQAEGELFGWGGMGFPYILTQFVGFAIFLVAVQAELTQPPFDMPVAESEIVGGYQVEYTGFRFLFFFMAEFGTAFAFAGIASVLFLGGWYVPGLDPTSGWFNLIGPFVMFIKIMAVSALIFWFRFTFPRLREDQLQKLAWKVLIPLALGNIVVTGVLKVLV